MKHKTIPTFIINLKKRTDRKAYILKEFSGRDEFNVNVVEACEHEIGAIGLWETIKHILQNLVNEHDDYVLICEDDHQFTKRYSTKLMYDCIALAMKNDADVMSGGVSWLSSTIKVSKNLVWVEYFNGTQFIVIFKPFFKTIIEASFNASDAADHKISDLSDKILFVHPFISIQKDFGYSDATVNNNQQGRVSKLFKETIKRFLAYKRVEKHYKKLQEEINAESRQESYDNIVIPTYIINLKERTERLEHIRKQFEGKPEFDITIVEACKHPVGAYGLWLSIRKIITMAMENDDDVIIICEDDHQFTTHYSKTYLLSNIIEAHAQGATYLSGGTGRFGHAIPITENRYWVNSCLSTQFIVLYKKFFLQILDEPFDESVVADLLYSEMTSNKMVLYPFISTQYDFGYSDVTDLHNQDKNAVSRLFSESSNKFKVIQTTYLKYNAVKKRTKAQSKYLI